MAMEVCPSAPQEVWGSKSDEWFERITFKKNNEEVEEHKLFSKMMMMMMV